MLQRPFIGFISGCRWKICRMRRRRFRIDLRLPWIDLPFRKGRILAEELAYLRHEHEPDLPEAHSFLNGAHPGIAAPEQFHGLGTADGVLFGKAHKD